MGWMDFLSRRSPIPTRLAPPDIEREQLITSLLVMAWMVEARDPYTDGHLWRVSRYAALLCDTAGVPTDQGARIAIGGFLHDMDKVGVPDAILRKRDRLDDDEYAVIKTHPAVGARMLASHPLAGIARYRVVASRNARRPGLPARPRGERHPAVSAHRRSVRCVRCDDQHPALRGGIPIPQALAIIESQLGCQFDEGLGRQFLALGRHGLLEHIAGHGDDGIPLQTCLMCGPTLVVRREQFVGDALFCRACGGGYRLEPGRDDVLPQAVAATGDRGLAAELEPEADTAQIQRFVRETARLAFASVNDL